jgi:hypothetical protein
MNQEKLNVAQNYIENFNFRIESLKKSIEREIHYLQEAVSEGKYNWVENHARKITEYTTELSHYEKMQQECRDLMEFLLSEDKTQ